jgi:hypothetical protein
MGMPSQFLGAAAGQPSLPIVVTGHIDNVGDSLDDGITSHRSESGAPRQCFNQRHGGRPGDGHDNKVREGANREALDRESAGHAGRHMLRGGDGAGNYGATP